MQSGNSGEGNSALHIPVLAQLYHPVAVHYAAFDRNGGTKMKNSIRGQTLVEFALVLPLMVLIVMMLADLGRGVYFYSVIFNAAREGARYGVAMMYPVDNSPEIDAAVRKLAIGLDQSALTVTSDYTDSSEANEDIIKVTVTYNFSLITPLVGNFIGANPFILTSTSTMHVEQ